LGAVFFAICALPQVIKAVKTKSTKDLSYFYIYFSIFGNIFSAIYIFYTNYSNGFWQYPQYFNYGIALLLIIILLYVKTKYDNQTREDEEMNEEIIEEKQYDYEPDTVADALNWLNTQFESGGKIIEEKVEENV
jgi:uncharacterized protein with PQ loop repeat